MNPLITRIAAAGIAVFGGSVFALTQLVPQQEQRQQVFTAPNDAEEAQLASSLPSLGTLVPDAGGTAEIVTRPAVDAGLEDTHPIPEMPSDPVADLRLAQPDLPVLAEMAQPDFGAAVETIEISSFGLACGLTVSTEAQPAAMVAIDIQSPCQPNARVIVEHNGLTVAAVTDGMGLLSMDIPALESPAFFTIRVSGADPEVALVTVPDLADYDRVGVAWVNDAALQVHAMEFGASYGDSGHVSAASPRSPDRAVRGEGGFLTVLGDASIEDPMMAEIYTFPRDSLNGDGVVRLSLEAPITEASCGDAAQARTLQSEPDGVVVTELTFTLPGCEAVGDSLVLQNLLRDLRLAAN